MRKADRECRRLADIQAKLFEESVTILQMSSEVFVRRFMNSKIATELDNYAFLEDSKSTKDIFDSLDEQYGKLNYGSFKYHKDVMFWSGYLYRHFCYCYEVTSKQACKLLPFRYVASTFEAFHTLDVMHAISRLLESRNITFDEEELNKKG